MADDKALLLTISTCDRLQARKRERRDLSHESLQNEKHANEAKLIKTTIKVNQIVTLTGLSTVLLFHINM